MIKSPKTWILIADSSRARILRHCGPGKGLEAVDGHDFRSEQRKLRDILADRPGRVHDSAGKSRHAMEPATDAVRQDETAFARSLAAVLAKALRRRQFDRLVLVAPPKALGDLRSELSAPVQAALIAEVNKDLTGVPNPDVANHLENVLFV